MAHQLAARHLVLRHQEAHELQRGVVLRLRVGVAAGVKVLQLDADRDQVAAIYHAPVDRPRADTGMPGDVLVGHHLRDIAGLVDVEMDRDRPLVAAALAQVVVVARPARGGRVHHHHTYAAGIAGLKMLARYTDLLDLHRLSLLLSIEPRTAEPRTIGHLSSCTSVRHSRMGN